jgi:hypothetical protein
MFHFKEKKMNQFRVFLMVFAAAGLANVAFGTLAGYYEFEAFPPVDSTGTTTAAEVGSGLALSTDVPEGIGSSNSLSFGGAGSLDLLNAVSPTASLLNAGEYDATIAFWMKADAASNVAFASVLADRSNFSTYTIRAYRSSTSANLSVNIRGLVSTIIPDVFDNQWHHIAVVIDQAVDGDNSEGIKFYKDGALVDSDVGVSWFVLKKETMLGNDPVESSHFYNGLLDDVRVYTHKLSASEIGQLVPEPATLLMLGLGSLLLRRKRR